MSNFNNNWNKFWFDPISGKSLSILRVVFGTVALMKQIGMTNILHFRGFNLSFPKHVFNHEALYWDFTVQLPHPIFEWLPIPTFTQYYILENVVFVVTFLWTIGFLSRITGPILSVLFGYILFLSQMTYHHHLWQMFLVLTILGWSATDRFYSIDALIGSVSKSQIRITPIRLIQGLVSIIYFFAASSKFSSGWYKGETLRAMWMGTKEELVKPIITFIDQYHFFPVFGTMTFVTMYFLSIGFWIKKTRRLALITGLGLHTLIETTAGVGTFSYQMWTIYLAFFYLELEETGFNWFVPAKFLKKQHVTH